MNLSRPSSQFADVTVGISISQPPNEDLAARGLDALHLDHVFVEIARHLLALGASVAYGGHPGIPGFSKVLFDLVRNYDIEERLPENRITNWLAWPIHESMDVNVLGDLANVGTLEYVGLPTDLTDDPTVREMLATKSWNADTPERRRIWARCLTAMRREMSGKTQARVILGGQGGSTDPSAVRFKGKYPGIFEEAALAISEVPTFVLGGFGGAAKDLVDVLNGVGLPRSLSSDFHATSDSVYREMLETLSLAPDEPVDYPALAEKFQRAGISGLKNGLSHEENRRLFESDDIDEMIGLVVKGLIKCL
jgi:hypothetical protein